MVSRREGRALFIGLGLALCGAVGVAVATQGLWLALLGTLLMMMWLLVTHLLLLKRSVAVLTIPSGSPDDAQIAHHLLLDASPTPLVLVTGTTVRTMNRAARHLFATDDRILPPPSSLFNKTATHLRHAGQNWRADRVEVGDRSVVALIDIEGEERTAEARASADMIQVLGHEMLNGLVPIVSLADEEMIDDLARLFASRWPGVRLSIDVAPGLRGEIDRDQMNQAIWALLQNAVEAVEQCGMPSGRIDIRATAGDDVLIIEVADDGPGIPPDCAHTIFRPFYTSKAGGSGIGLSLARQVVQAHGGVLTLVKLFPTTFRAQLPGAAALYKTVSIV